MTGSDAGLRNISYLHPIAQLQLVPPCALETHVASICDIGWILFSAHRYDEATRELRVYLATAPNDVIASGFWHSC